MTNGRVIAVVMLVALTVLVVGMGWWLTQGQSSTPSNSDTEVNSDRACGLPSSEAITPEHTINITEAGFDTTETTVTIGQTVRWVNQDQSIHTVTSDSRPIHQKCFGFESTELAAGQQFSFTFTKAGTWNFYDHLNPQFKGFVVVTE